MSSKQKAINKRVEAQVQEDNRRQTADLNNIVEAGEELCGDVSLPQGAHALLSEDAPDSLHGGGVLR